MDSRGRRGTRHPRGAPPRRGGDLSPRPERVPGGSRLEPQREPQPLPVRLAILRTLRRPDRESVRGRRVVRRQGPRKPPPRGGGVSEAMSPTAEMREIVLRAAAAVGGGVLAVDLMESPEGLVVHEVNPTPEFRALSGATGINVAAKVVDYVAEMARR